MPAVVIFKLLFYKEYKNLVGFLVALLLTFIVIYSSVHINLKDYVINSVQIISGYRSAMQLGTYDNFHSSYRLSLFLIILYFIQFYFIRGSLKKINLIILPVIMLSVYFFFAYSYTRAGIEGGLIYGNPIIVLVFFLIIFIVDDLKWKIRFFNINILVLFLCTLTFITTDFINLKDFLVET